MSKIGKINKPILLKYEDRMIDIPEKLREDIDCFWKKAIQENPNLYNGEDYTIESENETENQIEMKVVKSNYAHYLYNERIGIKEEKYRCCAPWSGILLLTTDQYFVIGEMSKTTSVPHCLQVSGGGFDTKDIHNGIMDIDKNLKRELKEEMNLNLDDITYKIEYMEYPTENRNAYGFLAIGKINKTKLELEKHFEDYRNYLIENKLEVEFEKLIFLHQNKALKELDNISNPKRPYLRDLIKEAEKYIY